MTNKELVKKWFSHIDGHQFAELRKLMDEKHSFRNSMTPTPIGAEQHIGMVQMMTSAIKGEHQLDLILESGDYVTVSGKWKGKHTGEFNGIPATNNSVEFPFIDIFHIVKGKVTDEHMEMNPMIIMQQIGAMPSNA
jgi:predicted ester cyclase